MTCLPAFVFYSQTTSICIRFSLIAHCMLLFIFRKKPQMKMGNLVQFHLKSLLRLEALAAFVLFRGDFRGDF